MTTTELICINCPIGCMLTATVDADNIEINGNNCKLGISYGINELKAPKRVVTTSIKNGSKMLSLKTSEPIPKDKIKDCLREVKNLELNKDVEIGDVVIKNILGLEANIVATRRVRVLA